MSPKATATPALAGTPIREVGYPVLVRVPFRDDTLRLHRAGRSSEFVVDASGHTSAASADELDLLRTIGAQLVTSPPAGSGDQPSLEGDGATA